jgi:hypothetical protein
MNYVLASMLLLGLVIEYFTMGKDMRSEICKKKRELSIEETYYTSNDN